MFAAAQSAHAAQNWTGNKNSDYSNSSNWGGNGGGRRYFNKNNLTGNMRDFVFLSKNVSEKDNTGLCFYNVPDRGYWRFQGQGQYTFDNSGNKGSDYDQDLICIGYSGAGSKVRIYAITLKTRHLTVGGDASAGSGVVKYDMTGHLILDDKNNDANGYLGPVNITTTKTCDFYKGDLYATNANITCQGAMTLYDFVAEKSGGKWTVTGKFTIGAKPDASAKFTQTDGTMTLSDDFIVGAQSGASATFTQKSGTMTVPGGKWTKSMGGAGTLNLDGGTFATYHIKDESGSLTVNFNGGTLKPHPSGGVRQGELMAHGNGTGLSVNVGENGGTIDTCGYSFSVGVAVNAVENTAGPFTVTGGGSVTFPAMGSLAGALTVGDNTALHWFDQNGAVSATCGFTSLALGAGSTIYLDGDATGVDALPATVTTTATAESKANVVIDFSAIPATGSSFTLFQAASADAFNVSPMFGGLVLPHEVAVVNGNLVLTITAEDYVWKGTQTNWGDADAWTKGGAGATWADGNNAIFQTANATATLAADASAAKIEFNADATVNGSATLSVPSVSVASDVAATISAPTSGALEKTGAGTLVLGSSRTAQTTLSEGTLAMAAGTTVDASKLTLGTDAAKPVVFDYGGQTLTADPASYLATGMDITLTNGVFSYTANNILLENTLPAVLTVAKDATLQTSQRFGFNYNGDGLYGVLNVRGGTVKSDKNDNNWIMQKSYSGRLDINVTDGGLLEFGGETYMLTCRDNEDIYESPELRVRVVDSTFRVKNGKSARFGFDAYTKASATPVFTLGATNSVFDIGYGIYLGNDKTGLATDGSYKADFNNCVVTAKEFRVYGDRPANNALFDGSTIAFNAEGDVSAPDADAKWITVAAGGLTLDTNGKAVSLAANLGGAGSVAKTGAGTLTVAKNQTSAGGFTLESGTLAFASGCTAFSRALSAAAGTTIDIAGGEPVVLVSLALPAEGTVALTKGGAAFAKGVYKIFSGISAATVQDKLVPSIADDTPYSWTVENGVLLLNVGNLAGNAWTGFAGDGLMSSDGNWLDGSAPLAGETIDFSGITSATEITADVDATFGAVTMGAGVITFKGDKMAATSFTDTSKIAVGANSKVKLAGDLTIQDQPTSYILNKVDGGGAFVVTGKITSTGKNIEVVQEAGDGYIVAGGLEINDSGSDCWLYTTKDATSQHWAVGSQGIAGTAKGGVWCRSNKANDCYIQPYDSDFSVSAWTVVREAIDHHELNTTGYDDGRPHVITLDVGFADTGALYIAGAGKVVVNHVTAAFGGKAAYSGPVTVQDAATLAINAGKKLTTGKTTFAAGTTLEVPSTGVEMGEIAFSGTGTATLKVSDAALADGEYTLLASTSDLPSDVLTRFAVSANTESETCLVTLDNRTLRLVVGSRAAAGSLYVWTGKAGDRAAGTAGNWLAGEKPVAGANVFIPASAGTLDFGTENLSLSSITFGYGSDSVTINGENAITGVVAITNLSSASHTINVPVRFAGDIQVKQAAMAEVGDLAKAHITFAGGAYAAEGHAIENANSAAVYSRCMFGKYYLYPSANSPWTAAVQGTNNRICLADNSSLEVPYAGSLKELYIGTGSTVTNGTVALEEDNRLSYRNNGEYVVTDEFTVSGSGGKNGFSTYNVGTGAANVFKIEKATCNKTDGYTFYFADGNVASRGTYYFGKGGVNFGSGKGYFSFGRNADGDAQTIHPWYGDFTIGTGAGNTAGYDLYMFRSVTFNTDDENGVGRTITLNARPKFNYSPSFMVDGSGTVLVNSVASNTVEPAVAVAGTATLAFKPGASLGTGTTTVGSGATLKVAGSGDVTLAGGLTLEDGATLKFNFTERDKAPKLKLTGGSVKFGAKVKVSVNGADRPAAGVSHGVYVLSDGINLKEAGVEVVKAADCARWVKAVGIDETTGEIYAKILTGGFVVVVK